MKHDVRIERDIGEEGVEELLNSGYNLIGFSVESHDGYGGDKYHFIFSKEIKEKLKRLS